MKLDESNFPIEILYRNSGEKEIIQNPKDIKSGKAFMVLRTMVKDKPKKGE